MGRILPTAMGGTPASLDEFNRLELYAKVQRPPQVKYKDLEAIVTSRVVRDSLKFQYRTDFLKVTSDTVLVPISVQIPNNQLSFKAKDGVHSAQIDIFGRISTVTDKVVQTFEDSVMKDYPDSLFPLAVKQVSDLPEGSAAAPRVIPAGSCDQGCQQRKRGSNQHEASGSTLRRR